MSPMPRRKKILCSPRLAGSIPCSSLFRAARILHISHGPPPGRSEIEFSQLRRFPPAIPRTIAASPKRSFEITVFAHEWIETHETANPLYIANNADRCYHCKDELFTRLDSVARDRHFAAIAYGVNSDDTRDFRPGHRAAAEHKVLAPLLEAGLSKSEIRFLSRRAGLETWDRPASPCLSSRVPYGTAVTPELLAKVERAEQSLRDLGFRQFRVRAFAETARVEIAQDELPRALESNVADQIDSGIKHAGFFYVAIDLEGYRQGSLNAALHQK